MIIVFWTPGPLHRLAFHCLTTALYSEMSSERKFTFKMFLFTMIFKGQRARCWSTVANPVEKDPCPQSLCSREREISFLMKIGWYLYGISWPYIFRSFLIPRCVLAQFIYILPRSGQRTELLLRENCTQCVSVLVAQLYLTLCDPMDCSLPGPSVHGILQARILEWVAVLFSSGSSQTRDQTQHSCIAEYWSGLQFHTPGDLPGPGSTRVSCIAGGFFTVWATREAPLLYEAFDNSEPRSFVFCYRFIILVTKIIWKQRALKTNSVLTSLF